MVHEGATSKLFMSGFRSHGNDNNLHILKSNLYILTNETQSKFLINVYSIFV